MTNLWVLRLELVLKPLLHSGQMCGFSPVCVLMCLFKRLGLSNVFPQTLQGSIVFSFGLLPGPVLVTVCCARPRESRGLMPGARRKPGGGPEGSRGAVAEERAGSRKLR